MSRGTFDASHDFSHIKRVQKLAQHLCHAHQKVYPDTSLDTQSHTLAGLLHDVSDHKYALQSSAVGKNEDIEQAIAESILLAAGADPCLASVVQVLVSHVSCSYKLAHPEAVTALVQRHPELAMVQGAGCLDAIGVVGIGRAFTFGGAGVGRWTLPWAFPLISY